MPEDPTTIPEDTWSSRDLPVLRAVVELFDRTATGLVRPSEIETACGFDKETVQRALRALNREPYFTKVVAVNGGEIVRVGSPNGQALRVAGQWPSPEAQLERLVAAFAVVADDVSRPEDERSKAKQVGLYLSGALAQIAIGALGGAGGNLITG